MVSLLLPILEVLSSSFAYIFFFYAQNTIMILDQISLRHRAPRSTDLTDLHSFSLARFGPHPEPVWSASRGRRMPDAGSPVPSPDVVTVPYQIHRRMAVTGCHRFWLAKTSPNVGSPVAARSPAPPPIPSSIVGSVRSPFASSVRSLVVGSIQFLVLSSTSLSFFTGRFGHLATSDDLATYVHLDKSGSSLTISYVLLRHRLNMMDLNLLI